MFCSEFVLFKYLMNNFSKRVLLNCAYFQCFNSVCKCTGDYADCTDRGLAGLPPWNQRGGPAAPSTSPATLPPPVDKEKSPSPESLISTL